MNGIIMDWQTISQYTAAGLLTILLESIVNTDTNTSLTKYCQYLYPYVL